MMLSIFHIGFSAAVDGPGQRMVIYCKGCNLKCPWCASPESISFLPQVLFYAERVTSHADAISVCPYGAIYNNADTIARNIEKCKECSQHICTKTGHPAFELVGKKIEISALAALAKRYRPFYGRFGGVTIGGGEPTCQYDSLRSLLYELKNHEIHTAIETNGIHPELPQLYDLIDLLYIDLKHPDPSSYPGANGDKVLENIIQRHSHGGQMIVRIPLVAGYNADPVTANSFGKTLSSVGSIKVEVLPYHTRGLTKWRACAMPISDQPLNIPTKENIDNTIEILQSYGLSL